MMTVAAGVSSRPPLSSLRAERGASSVEYGLLITGIAVVLVIVIIALGVNVLGLFNDSCTAVTNETGGNC